MSLPSIRSLVKDVTYHPKERAKIFSEIDPKQQPRVLLRLSKYIQSQLLSELKKETLMPILEHLDPDDATDVLRSLPKRRQNDFVGELSEGLQNKVSMLLKFDPQTAAGLMSLNYIQVDGGQRLSEVSEQIHTHEKRTGRMPVILVLEEGKLTGFLPTKELVFAEPGDRVRDFSKRMATVRESDSYESVINRFLDHPHRKIAVLNEEGNIMGVIFSDDVLRVLQEKEASSLYDFAGVSNEETIFGTAKQKIKYRYKWLIINLGTAFLASFVVSLFHSTIEKYVLLAVYMPIVAGMGGNSATQTLAVLVRGIALKQIDLETCLPTLKRELLAAFANGIINGILVAAIVIIFNRDWKIALILASAMTINLLVAGFFGTLVPLIMVKLKKDPATSATIFITTATDVLGFMTFLGLATVILGG
jgi:magnesium transporter